ncbi:MAG: LptF/LptG family permease [bacterium]|jgi:lipopolysaccharide export system permease protein|nr:LptF/LptG family permease [bacterium]
MSILTRYLLRRFLGIALFTALASLLVFITVDLMEHLDKFIDTQTPGSVILRYYILYTPQILTLIFPVILLLTTVFTLGGLVKRMEVTAMKAGGVSPGRLMRLMALWALVASGLSFLVGETLVTDTARERMEIYRTTVKRMPATLTENSGRIYFQNDERSFLTLENYSIDTGWGRRATYLHIENDRVMWRLDADTLRHTDQGWLLLSGEERRLWPSHASRRFTLRMLDELKLDPGDIETLQAVPEEMNLRELEAFIDRQKQAGAYTRRWEVNAHGKMASPVANLVIVLFGVPLALRRHRAGLMLGFGLSLLAAFAYYGLQVVCQNLGYKALLSPPLAAWLPNAAFAAAAVLLYWRVDR